MLHIFRRKRTRRAGSLLASVVLVPLLFACSGPREPLSQDEIRQKVETYLAQEAQADRFSGTVLVAQDGVPIVAQGYGNANWETQTPNSPDTAYALASIPKMFTAIAIGQLAEQGKLSLDDPISQYLPDYPAEVANKVTIKHLLSHSSGLVDFFFVDPEEYKAVIASPDHKDYIQLFANKPLRFEPGTQFEYNNSGFLLLGQIIERVSGQSYYDYVQENIFEPAGIEEMYWAAEDVPAGRLALPYTNVGEDGRPMKEGRRLINNHILMVEGVGPVAVPWPKLGGAYGGGYTTVGELLKFFQAVRQNTLLGEEYTQVLLAGAGDGRGFSKDLVAAYGFFIRPVYGQSAVGHGGYGPGIATAAYMYPNGYDIIVLANYNYPEEDLTAKLNDWLVR